MSRGNYHLTIAATPEAPDPEMMSPHRVAVGKRAEKKRMIMTAGPFFLFLLNLTKPKPHVRWFFFSMALKDNYDCIF